MSRNSSQSVTQNGNSVKPKLSFCKMYHHRTLHLEHSSDLVASKQPSQTGATGSKPSYCSRHTSLSHIPPPSHHYVWVSCLKAMHSIYKKDKSACLDKKAGLFHITPAALPKGMDMFVCSGADHLGQW